MLSRPGSGLPIPSQVLRPMITGLPMVTSRKYLRSEGMRHGTSPWAPMTPFSATATTREISTAYRLSSGEFLHRGIGVLRAVPSGLADVRQVRQCALRERLAVHALGAGLVGPRRPALGGHFSAWHPGSVDQDKDDQPPHARHLSPPGKS